MGNKEEINEQATCINKIWINKKSIVNSKRNN